MLPNDKFLITDFYGIRESFLRRADGSVDESRLAEMAEAGLNLVTLEGSPDTNKKALDVCEKLGLLATVIDSRMGEALRMETGWEKIVEAIVGDYKDYPALFNYHVLDEPSNAVFPALRAVSDKLLELDPKHEPYINLFPNYATPKQLGAPDYATHIEDFIREVRPTLLSYDHYHFCRRKKKEAHEFASERDRLIYEDAYTDKNRAGFFDNIEQIRASALAHGLPFMVIVLLVEHGPYRYLSEAELRWEVFQSLAYGANAISYFTYWTPQGGDEVWHWKEGMISVDGEKLQHYYDVQRINPELQRLGTELLGARSEAVFHIGECDENVKFFDGYGAIEKVEAPSVTLGFFEGDRMLIANKDYKNAAPVEITTAAELQKFDKTTGIWSPLPEKRLILAPGDAELVLIK